MTAISKSVTGYWVRAARTLIRKSGYVNRYLQTNVKPAGVVVTARKPCALISLRVVKQIGHICSEFPCAKPMLEDVHAINI